jgi:DNA-binding NarL/FixJ family response regulator
MRTSSVLEKSTVVIVEDHPMFREQIAHLIGKQADMMVCGEADNIQDGLALIKEKKPSIAIVDISLRGSSGLELLKDLRAQEIELPILVLSMHEESLYAERAIRAGARGYITKHEASEKVMFAIREVLRGEIYLNPRVMSQVVTRIAGTPDAEKQPIQRLTDRELEVFELIGRGQRAREISARLGVGLTTVDTYRARIKDKLNLENAVQLQVEATRFVRDLEYRHG